MQEAFRRFQDAFIGLQDAFIAWKIRSDERKMLLDGFQTRLSAEKTLLARNVRIINEKGNIKLWILQTKNHN